METPAFTPKPVIASDQMSERLFGLSRMILVVVIGLLPLLFIPGLVNLTTPLKVFVTVGATALATIVASLGFLRAGRMSWQLPRLLLAWWGVVLAAVVAGLMAPQQMTAFLGDSLEVHTVGFLLLLGIITTLVFQFRASKSAIIYLYGAWFISAFVLSVLHLARIIFGPEILTFGLLASPAATLVGTFNDLGLYLALVVMVGLISLLQLTLPKKLQALLTTIIVVSVIMLGVINFFMVWIILGLFSLLLLMYTLTRGRLGTTAVKAETPSFVVTILSLVVFLSATLFIIGGSSLGSFVANQTGVSYLEVQPSTSATLDILRATLSDQAFTGAGPNHFGEVWTKYKDASINGTLFWNTTFNAGSGYIPTWFVTSGIVGMIAWVVFLGFFVWAGIEALIRSTSRDTFWYFIATISYTSSLFVLVMSFWYVPGPVVLIIGITSLGLFAAAHSILVPRTVQVINLLANSRTGFVLISLVMITIVGTITVGYVVFRQFMGLSTYAAAAALPAGPERSTQVTLKVAEAAQFYRSDTYLRDLALYKVAEMQAILATENPTEADTARLNEAASVALQAANEAILVRGNDARNWSVRGDVFTLLAAIGYEDAGARALADYNEARARDPQNPYYDFQAAGLAIAAGDESTARAKISEALTRKPNYTDALVLLSQLEIARGNLKEAIKTTESLLVFEPNNPGRYYQLGVLYGADNNAEAAVTAFTNALTLNPQYANARYMRALQILAGGDQATAITELEMVRDMNPDNASVNELIERVKRGEVTTTTVTPAAVTEPEGVTRDGEAVTTNTDPNSPLVTPVNTVPNTASSTRVE